MRVPVDRQWIARERVRAAAHDRAGGRHPMCLDRDASRRRRREVTDVPIVYGARPGGTSRAAFRMRVDDHTSDTNPRRLH
jgi:hypothetical protein